MFAKEKGGISMKIVNVKRFVRSVLIILGLIICMSLFLMSSTLSYKELEYKTIYVCSGDTLWSISADLQSTNDYYKGKDVRDIIENLVKLNNLDSKTIYAGQELVVPI